MELLDSGSQKNQICTGLKEKQKKENCKYNLKISIFQCNDTCNNSYYGIPEISKFCENINQQKNDCWKAPDGLF